MEQQSSDIENKIKSEVYESSVSERTIDVKEKRRKYRKSLRKIDYRILVVYAISYVFVQINKGNISNVAILNLEEGNGIKKELGNLSSSQWAWCLSAFYYPYLIFEAPFTILAKKFGPRKWQSRIMISWGIVSMLQATTYNFSGMIACRFFLGFFEASWYTTVLYHMAFFYKPRELPKRVAFFYSCGMLSTAFSGLLAYGISYMNQDRGLSGWRWVFIFEGIPTILLGIYQVFYLPDYVDDSTFLTEEEKDLILENHPSTSPNKEDSFFHWPAIKALLQDETFYTYIGIWLFQGIGGWGISFVLPTIIYQLGFTDTANTQLMQLPPSIFGFILLNILGNLTHRKILKAFPVAFVMSLCQIVCYVVLLVINNNVGKYIMLIIATGISNSLYPILWPDRIRVVKGTSSSALAIGATNGSCQLMGIIGPIIYQSKFGPLYHVSYACSIGLCSVSFIFIGITWIIIHRRGLSETEGAEKVSIDESQIT